MSSSSKFSLPLLIVIFLGISRFTSSHRHHDHHNSSTSSSSSSSGPEEVELRRSLQGRVSRVASLTDEAGPWNGFKTLLGAQPGDVRPGLAGLKSYLLRFGYIGPADAPPAFTDEFDNVTQRAVTMYQQSFGLPVTGRLDVQTLTQMIIPRCGREDVINGTLLMSLIGSPAATKRTESERNRHATLGSRPLLNLPRQPEVALPEPHLRHRHQSALLGRFPRRHRDRDRHGLRHLGSGHRHHPHTRPIRRQRQHPREFRNPRPRRRRPLRREIGRPRARVRALGRALAFRQTRVLDGEREPRAGSAGHRSPLCRYPRDRALIGARPFCGDCCGDVSEYFSVDGEADVGRRRHCRRAGAVWGESEPDVPGWCDAGRGWDPERRGCCVVARGALGGCRRGRSARGCLCIGRRGMSGASAPYVDLEVSSRDVDRSSRMELFIHAVFTINSSGYTGVHWILRITTYTKKQLKLH